MTASPLIRALLAVAVYLVTLAAAAAADHKRIIVLHSFGREFRPWNEYARAIRAELDRQSPWVLDVQEYSLVNARTNSNPELPFVEYLAALYADDAPDLILCIGAPAAAFIQSHRQRLFPTVPMVFTAVEQRRIDFSRLTEFDTVVAVRHDFRYMFESFLQIAPQTRVVAMVVGNSPNELYWKEEMLRELRPLASRIDIRWYNSLPFAEILQQFAALPEHSAIFWFQMTIDGAGVAHEGERALRSVYAVANAPIFTTDAAFFGREIIGGPMHSPAGLGQRTASVAMRILSGEKPAALRTAPSDVYPPRYDWRELRRWKVSEGLLPPNATIEFRDPTIWQTYRLQIVFIFAVVLAQAILISLLLHERNRRNLAEVQSRQRMSELAHVNRFFTADELTTSIAHEINQPLAAIRANADTAQLLFDSAVPDLDELRAIVADIRRDEQRASDVISHLRVLLKKAPLEQQDADLNDILNEALDFLSALTVGRKVEVNRLLDAAPLPIRGDRIQLQQVILNLIVNAMDAMSAMAPGDRRIAVKSFRDGDTAVATISDAGPGIPAGKLKDIFEPFFTTKAHGMGMGLSIARTIIEAHNGQLLAENQAMGGAMFSIRLPLR